MYLYCLDCDVKVTIMWIKFEKKRKRKKKESLIERLCLMLSKREFLFKEALCHITVVYVDLCKPA